MQPVNIDYGYVDVDTMEVTIPEGYVIEALPSQVNEVAPMGELSQTFKADGNTITIVTRYMMRGGRYPASEYNTLRNFKSAVKKAYDQRIVLRRN